MATLNISMPIGLRAYVDERTRTGGFGTPTEYIRHLIREDRARETEHRLELLLLDGVDSEVLAELTPEWWEAKRSALTRKATKRATRTKRR